MRLSSALLSFLLFNSSTVYSSADPWYCPQGVVAYHPYTCVRNFYVNMTSGNDSNSGSNSSPWKTIQGANDSNVLRAGDCVNVAAGKYPVTGSGYNALNLTVGGNSNTSTGYVTYISAPNNGSVISGNSSLINLVNIEVPYIILDGFEIDATSVIGTAVTNDNFNSAHHIQILNNYIHNAGAAGVGFGNSDYFTVYGNYVTNNAWTNPIRSSGITVYEPMAINGFTPTLPADKAPFHISIQNNVTAGNSTQNNCAGVANCSQSDGHGIIADDWLHTQNAPNIPYPYQGLIQSNLSFNNGGAGVAVFISQNVTVANNTAYRNFNDTYINTGSRGEIFVVGSTNINLQNNIMYAFPATDGSILQNNAALLQSPMYGPAQATVSWTHNLTFDGTLGDPSANIQTANASQDLATFKAANQAGVWPMLNPYAPVAGSPALATGIPTPSYPPKSLCGAPMTSPPNIGAY